MKKLSYLLMFGILVIAGSLTSCQQIADDIQDSAEVTIHTEFEAPFVAVPDASKALADGSFPFSTTAVIDPKSNPDLADYLEKIQSIEIVKVQVKVTEVSHDNLVLLNSTYTLTDSESDGRFAFSSEPDLGISVDTKFSVGAEHPDWDVINQIINNMHAGVITANGSFNQENFEVGFTYIISVKVVAKP